MSSHEYERRGGALECIKALSVLVHSAEILPESADEASVFFSIQQSSAKALSDLFGPLTPRQEGAVRALAEYIHYCETTGQPNLEKWRPIVAMTPSEWDGLIKRCDETAREYS